MAIKNAWTEIEAQQTLTEIQQLLAKKGASNMMIFYEGGEPAGLDFLIMVDGSDGIKTPVRFRLPANVEGVARVLSKSKRRELQGMERARNTAWRNVKLWIEAQFALIEAGQAQMAQVFLPYAIGADGRTVYEHFEEAGLPMLNGHSYA